MAEVFQHLPAELTKMQLILRSAQVLKQEAEEMGLQRKYIPDYVKRNQALDREERAAWSDTQKMQAQADVELGKIQADAEEKRRTDEIRMAKMKAEAEEKKRADEIQIQMAQIQAAKDQAKREGEKELALELKSPRTSHDQCCSCSPSSLNVPNREKQHSLN